MCNVGGRGDGADRCDDEGVVDLYVVSRAIGAYELKMKRLNSKRPKKSVHAHVGSTAPLSCALAVRDGQSCHE